MVSTPCNFLTGPGLWWYVSAAGEDTPTCGELLPDQPCRTLTHTLRLYHKSTCPFTRNVIYIRDTPQRSIWGDIFEAFYTADITTSQSLTIVTDAKLLLSGECKFMQSTMYTPLQKKCNSWFRALPGPKMGSRAPHGQIPPWAVL